MAGNISVLIVDDDGDLLDSLRLMLEAHDFRVACAQDAAAAMTIIAGAPPDLVITDIYMPDSDGFELINALRSQAPDLPVIAMSGGGHNGDRYDNLGVATHLGAVAVLNKPFTRGVLMDTIARVFPNLPRQVDA